jgi:acyl carrier protein phosphodiesterase
MNLLAHAYLSFRQPELLVGNMISDYVKGRAKFDYAPGILRGIDLHRAIDEFTDQHPVNLRAKKVFKPAVGLYAGAFLDIVYDHFLAADTLVFPADSLPQFSNWVYGSLEPYQDQFPERFARMFPHMRTHDWLSNYREREGIARSMEGLVRRAKYLDQSEGAFQLFEQEYAFLEASYQRFFPELILFVTNYYRAQLKAPEKL